MVRNLALLILTVVLANGCASIGTLPKSVQDASMGDSVGGKVGWSRYQASDSFPGVKKPAAVRGARHGLNTSGFVVKREDPEQGIVIGEHGMTLYDWNIVCGVYILEQPDGCRVKVIAQGSRDIGFAGDATGSDWPQDVLRGMRNYLANNVVPPQPADTQGSVSLGTGFAGSPEGYIVTAFHVVDGKNDVTVKFQSGEWLKATVVSHSSLCDIAVLKVESATPAFLTVPENLSASIGDDVFTVGYPATELLGNDPKYTDGALSSLTGLRGDATLMQTTVPVQPGSSGGALVAVDGTVLGVVLSTAAAERFYRSTGALPQNVNWAIRSDIVYALISRYTRGITPVKLSSKKEAIERVQAATCHVKAGS